MAPNRAYKGRNNFSFTVNRGAFCAKGADNDAEPGP